MNQQPRSGLTRRSVLGSAGVGAAAIGLSACSFSSPGQANSAQDATNSDLQYPFLGDHQGGIVTPAQDRMHFVAFDVTTEDRAEVVALLNAWSRAAERLCRGEPIGRFGAVDGPALAPPEDTGEALDLPPSGLTLTFGFGPSFFSHADGSLRFGLNRGRPSALIDLPNFPGDKLDPRRSGGDICVQACANDPQVAVHAIRNLARIGFGTTAVRWSQLGFGRTSSTSTSQSTPRNLFGFKDGTRNLKAEDPDALREHLWVPSSEDDRMDGGTYLVARRINMRIEVWDRTSLDEQERSIGRIKSTGAPLSGGDEFAEIDFSMAGAEGEPIMPVDSHVFLSHPDNNDGAHMLRRGYNFTDGSDGLGRLDAGLFFLAYMRDPLRQYVPMQQRLATEDRLSVEYLQHTGSAIFAIPPGVRTNEEWIGERFFS